MPCAAGNDGDSEDPDNPQIELPARFDDDWVLAVGGTGMNGSWWGTDPNDEFIAAYGPGIDIAAPANDLIITTTKLDTVNQSPWGSIGNENGTSSATAHASGVAALLLSYLNDSISAYKNLAPEDVEYILQRSATYVGYDSAT